MDGVLIIDKPAGITSHDVVARVRRILKERRVGHTGTLDPFATGVLVVLTGRATRLAQFLSGQDKEYEALIRLGVATDTGDVTGRILNQTTGELPCFSKTELEKALTSLRGPIEQVPPMHSAKKQQGKKMYELARRGETVERKPFPVTIHAFDLIGETEDSPPQNGDRTTDIRVRVRCSAGTYIRTLAEDLGRQLGVGAHVVELRRTQAGRFCLEDSVTLEKLAEISEQQMLAEIMISPMQSIDFFPAVSLNPIELTHTQHGKPMKLSSEQAETFQEAAWIRMCDNTDTLIAVGQVDLSEQLLRPRVVLSVES